MPLRDRDRVLRPYEIAGRAVRGIDRATKILWDLTTLEDGDFFAVDIHGVMVAADRLAEACAAYETRWQKAHADPKAEPHPNG